MMGGRNERVFNANFVGWFVWLLGKSSTNSLNFGVKWVEMILVVMGLGNKRAKSKRVGRGTDEAWALWCGRWSLHGIVLCLCLNVNPIAHSWSLPLPLVLHDFYTSALRHPHVAASNTHFNYIECPQASGCFLFFFLDTEKWIYKNQIHVYDHPGLTQINVKIWESSTK